jgi:excisionase family DNA binding protein
VRQVSVAEAAEFLRVSGDTIKRMARTGRLKGEKDAAGRWSVWVEDASSSGASGQPAPAAPELERLQLRLSHAEDLVAELRSRVEAQDRQLDVLVKQIEADQEERAELRRLLAASMQLHALPATVEGVHAGVSGDGSSDAQRVNAAHEDTRAGAARRPWWAFWRLRSA